MRFLLVLTAFIMLVSSITGQLDDELEVGFHIGVLYGSVAAKIAGRRKVVPDEQGHLDIPCFVSVTSNGSIFVGEAARNQLSTNSEGTFYEIKDYLGRDYDDTTVKFHMEEDAFRVINEGGKPVFVVSTLSGDLKFSPEELTGMIIQSLKERVEKLSAKTVSKAVFTIPARYNDKQKKALEKAADLAGITVTQFIDEKDASSYSYKSHGKCDTVIVSPAYGASARAGNSREECNGINSFIRKAATENRRDFPGRSLIGLLLKWAKTGGNFHFGNL